MTLIEQFARRYAPRVVHNGVTLLSTNHDPLLQAAFAMLGWTDPQPEHGLPSAPVTATLESAERAVIDMPKAKGRLRG